MDLMNLTPTSDTLDVVLVHPSTLEPLLNDDKSEMTITMYAPHSKEYKAAVHIQTNKRLKQVQGKKKADITSESIEEATLEVLVKATKSWNNTYDGKKPECCAETAKEVYEKVFWIKDQLEEASTDLLDFTKG